MSEINEIEISEYESTTLDILEKMIEQNYNKFGYLLPEDTYRALLVPFAEQEAKAVLDKKALIQERAVLRGVHLSSVVSGDDDKLFTGISFSAEEKEDIVNDKSEREYCSLSTQLVTDFVLDEQQQQQQQPSGEISAEELFGSDTDGWSTRTLAPEASSQTSLPEIKEEEEQDSDKENCVPEKQGGRVRFYGYEDFHEENW